MSSRKQLVLFDIDGTLLDCGPQVRRIFGHALQRVFGTFGAIDEYDFAGKTDHRIVMDLMTTEGVTAARVETCLEELQGLYQAQLEAELDREQMRLLAGVEELLEALGSRSEYTMGLLTGNWECGARIKLSRFNLNGYFEFGAFGDGTADRNALPPVALRRAERAAGHSFSSGGTLIVGDSTRDVACGRAHDVPVLAVASGHTPARALADAGADWVVPSLATLDLRHEVFHLLSDHENGARLDEKA